ncbi:hypothetical protein MPSEU_000054500 [Mayamaea pseudoterrestris]|nr:hypothetical protein MPSEU_000054500 [Mayamaea pseudoterrestris]
MNGASMGGSSSRIRAASIKAASIARNDVNDSRSDNAENAASIPSHHLTLPSANTSADASKYSKRRKPRKYISNMTKLAAVVMTMCLTLVVFFYMHPSNTRFVKNQSSPLLREQLLAHLPKKHAHFHKKQDSNVAHDGTRQLEKSFHKVRSQTDANDAETHIDAVLNDWQAALDDEIVHNFRGGIRWTRPYLLPPLRKVVGQDDVTHQNQEQHKNSKAEAHFFKATNRMRTMFDWEHEWEELLKKQQRDKSGGAASSLGPRVDYTDSKHYMYPPLPADEHVLPPDPAIYPPLQPLSQVMETWPQDEDYDFEKHGYIHEQLWHFNFTNPVELKLAQVLRDHELPFKLYNVPELVEANVKWTDDYVSAGFGGLHESNAGLFGFGNNNIPFASGVAQESPNNYFAFFTPKQWNVHRMGLPPTRNSDWTFSKWAKHAKYADAVQLSYDQPHVYWQAGVDRMERYSEPSKWTFISRDLPSFASPTENFFVFSPQEQKGIQCRFGERGVVAATHYDGGRNVVGMVTGAKRYILSPPHQCSKLGVFTSKRSPIYRHSLLNFAHIQYLKDDTATQEQAKGMSDEEREWLERASQALSVETVLKAGEALYIPSHWFHYIISVQKSAQCNVRSGINQEGNPAFGNRETVERCLAE